MKCIIIFFVILQHYPFLVWEKVYFLGKEKCYNLKLYYLISETEFFP